MAMVRNDTQTLIPSKGELERMVSFCQAIFKNCDEFTNSQLFLDTAVVRPKLRLNTVRNVLHWNDSEGREAFARAYQRSDLYASSGKLLRPQLLGGNKIVVTALEQLMELDEMKDTMFCFNLFVVPAELLTAVERWVQNSANCVVNTVYLQQEIAEGELLLDAMVQDMVKVGTPLEYILSLDAKG